MNDRHNIVIVLLLVSAAMLSMMLYIGVQPNEAVAGNSSSRYGDYILCTGFRSQADDNLYIIDVQQKKLNCYWIEPGTDNFEPTDSVDLETIFRGR
jgi:hypothetical protein